MNSQDLISHYSICQSVLKRATDEITNGKGMVAPKEGGNCATWIVGHLVNTRNIHLEIMEKEPLFPIEKYTRYNQGTDPLSDSDSGLPFDELLTAYDKIHEVWIAALNEMTDDKLSAKAPSASGKSTDKTIGSLLSELSFHEAYHIGQLGLLRKVYGLAGPVG